MEIDWRKSNPKTELKKSMHEKLVFFQRARRAAFRLIADKKFKNYAELINFCISEQGDAEIFEAVVTNAPAYIEYINCNKQNI